MVRARPVPRRVLLPLAAILPAQVAGWIVPSWYPMILGISLAVLDAFGVHYLTRVARLGLNALPCRIAAVARGLGVGNAVALTAWLAGGPAWLWWAAVATHVGGMALLGFSTVIGPLLRLSGPHRQAFAAEMVAVGAAAVMVVWFAGLDPALMSGRSGAAWSIVGGLLVADLMLAMAIAAMLLRGMVNHWRDPITVLISGMVLAILADTRWATSLPGGVERLVEPSGGALVVTAHLLLTLSPLMSASGIGSVTDRARRADPPRWVAYLPLAALVTGVALLLVVIVRTSGWQRWSGLVVAMAAMLAAVTFRYWLSLRTSRARAGRDPETGLATRAALKEALAAVVRGREPFAVLVIAVAEPRDQHRMSGILRRNVRADDLVARIGPAAFGVLLTDAGVAAEATIAAQRILAAADDDDLRCSIGVAVARIGEPAKTVLRNAEIAMSHAVRSPASTFAIHELSMNDRRAVDAALAEALEGAQQRDELTVLYQPIVDLASGRVVAAEALLRWRHPLHGAISPSAFIPVAERSGEIVGIGRWVLEQAIQQVAAWREAGADLTVTVNVSPRQLQEPHLAREVLGALERAGVPARNLIVEVTESAMVEEAVEVAALRRLRSAGVRIAIDDFGTGYSSLQYLTRLPVDVLKIDRGFVARLDGTGEGAAIAEAVIRLAQILRLTTVAEGIETDVQAAELLALGSERGQGYLYSRPVPPEEVAALVERQRDLAA
ncbi:EAL domain, c-di-GMP-specific phosphodiesterase class I (or its enzymatically inactive variant) [Actinoplanes philippinensis]|uniref:EAL domain, c-di-GMP-specific phosphodiesterase class I (Or its enzymatically inactive variant) n=1 Tax=Actinoplanes philippinensis TaxID=35752 RepID=A0A1I2KVX0_9ACTN|nr:EAL domain, c-di-GMP-specific phosphodiesterase class I (or its enzymatically inactive variant) [Actinoplanes philippinensis]